MDPQKTNKTVLITGATGALGPRVVWAFHEAGCRIKILSTEPVDKIPTRLLPDDVEIILGDITDIQTVQPAMTGVNTVLHLAALLHIVNPSPSLKSLYDLVNVQGTRNVVEAAVQNNVERVVFFSTIAVYGGNRKGILTEETSPEPDSDYARTKIEAEQVVLEAKRSDGRPLGTALRLSAVYGSRIKGNYRRLLQSLNRGRFLPIGKGVNRRTLIYDRDVAKAALLAAESPEAAGQVFNVTDGRYHTVAEIIDTMCQALNRNPPRFTLPIKPIALAAGLSEDILGIINCKAPIGRASIEKYTEEIAVDGSKLQKHLGFSPQYNLKAGWEETVREMRQSGDL